VEELVIMQTYYNTISLFLSKAMLFVDLLIADHTLLLLDQVIVAELPGSQNNKYI
jgi:hypothetical protein